MNKRPLLDCVAIVGKIPSRYEGEKTYISTGAVSCDHIDYTQAEQVTYENRPSRANLSVSEGDILFAKMQGTKKTLPIDATLAEYLFSTGFYALRADTSLILPEILAHFLSSDQFLTQKDKNCSGATQKALTNTGLKKITIQLPEIKEQQILATQLSTIEKITAARHKQLAMMDELVKSRFVEMFGDLRTNPFHWPLVKIRDISTFLKSGLSRKLSANDIGLPVIRSNNIQNGKFDSTDIKFWYKKDPQGANTSNYILDDGDILVNFINSASQIGKTAVFKSIGRECIYTTNIFRMKLSTNCDPVYYNWFAMTDYYFHQLQNIIQPAVNQSSFTTSRFLELNIPLPPLLLQQQFADFVSRVDSVKGSVEKSLQELETLKQSLLQQYFS